MSLLVIAPHFDDAEFGCGGLLAKFRGVMPTRVLVLSASSYKDARGQTIVGSVREHEGKVAASALGYELTLVRVANENEFLGASYSNVVGVIERHVKEWMPKLVVIPTPSYNQDHRVTYDACMTVLRPTWQPMLDVWAYEYPMSCWGPGVVDGPFVGKKYVRLDIDQMNLKLAALAAHKSQVFGKKGLSSCDGALALARMRGAEIGEDYAERFVPLREII